MAIFDKLFFHDAMDQNYSDKGSQDPNCVALPGSLYYWVESGGVVVHTRDTGGWYLIYDGKNAKIYSKTVAIFRYTSTKADGSMVVEVRRPADISTPDGLLHLAFGQATGQWNLYERTGGSWNVVGTYTGFVPNVNRTVTIIIDDDNSVIVDIDGTPIITTSLAETPPAAQAMVGFKHYNNQVEYSDLKIYTSEAPQGCKPAIAGTIPGAVI